MARFLGKQKDGEAGRFTVPREEIAPPPTANLPQVRIGVDFVRALEGLIAVFASSRRAPASCVAQAELGGDDLAYGGVGGFCVGWELQLGSMHDLDFGNIDGDDDAAGWDGRLSGKVDAGVVLVADVSIES